MPRNDIPCATCGKMFTPPKKTSRFCSRPCWADASSPNGNWKRHTRASFWSRVDKSEGDSGCWPFIGGQFINGYGRISFNGRQQRAHRLAWEFTHGAIPHGLHVCHTCDNPPCCNPSHLFLGTNQDNIEDKMAKGRHRSQRGSDHHASRLTEDDVRFIRDAVAAGKFTMADLAARYGVSHNAVSSAVLRKTWKHVP